MKKVKMQRLLGQKQDLFQRCVGMDAFNAVYSTTFEIDEKYGTTYHKNFVDYMIYVTGTGSYSRRCNDGS